MTAYDFYKSFIDNMREDRSYNGKSFFEIYKNYTEFTELVNKHIIHDIVAASEDGMEVQHEYFRIDTVGWKSNYKDIEKEAEEVGLNPHLWDLKIAVEHENSLRDWSDEVIKLIHIKCPLKVIIGYNYCDERDTKEAEKLEFIAKWMQDIDAFKNGKETEEYLIIIGNAYNSKTKAMYSEFGYKGYMFDWETIRFKMIG